MSNCRLQNIDEEQCPIRVFYSSIILVESVSMIFPKNDQSTCCSGETGFDFYLVAEVFLIPSAIFHF